MEEIRVGGHRVALHDTGDGDAVVLVHCSSATHRAWSFMIRELAPSHRVLAPDLFGYGRSEAWPPPPDRLATSDLDLVQAVVRRAEGPVHLIGHSYGAAVCLEVARRAALSGDSTVRSLLLVEPVSFHLLRSEGRSEDWRVVSRVARRCIEAAERGDRRAAATPYMSFWLGRIRWWLMPRSMRRTTIETIDKVAHEFRTMFELEHGIGDYGAIACPTTLVRGAETRRAAATVVDLLVDAIEGSRMLEIAGAGHMSPFTHRTSLRSAILEHLEQATG
jgi:pimeloyl-ACP methyl ester carboxylesterase